jgi:hypothetical protein
VGRIEGHARGIAGSSEARVLTPHEPLVIGGASVMAGLAEGPEVGHGEAEVWSLGDGDDVVHHDRLGKPALRLAELTEGVPLQLAVAHSIPVSPIPTLR